MPRTQITPSAESDSLVSSIMPALSSEGRKFLEPSLRRSQSVTALTLLEREVDYHDESMRVQEDHGEEKNGRRMERCASLPHLSKAVEVVRPSFDGDNVDNISITSAAKTTDIVKELESDLVDARDTIQILRDSLLDKNTNLSNLMCQLTEERDKTKKLGEELQVSRELCMELNGSRPSTDSDRDSDKYDCLHEERPRNVVVKEIGLQTALDNYDYEKNAANGAKNMTSPGVAHSSAFYQKNYWEYQSAHAPHIYLSNGSRHSKCNRKGTSCKLDKECHEEIHMLLQQCREKEFQIQKLTEKLSKYLQRNAEIEAEQISRQEDLEAVKIKLEYQDQEVSHLKEVVLNQQEDIALLEQIKENLHSQCSDLERREQELEELVDSLTEDMNGIAKEKKKLNRHVKELNSSLESKQIVISEKIEELEAQSNLLEVIKQVAFGSPSKQKVHTPRSVTSTPRNSPALPMPPKNSPAVPTLQQGSTEQKREVISADSHGRGATVVNHRRSSSNSQHVASSMSRAPRSKGKSSERIPSKQDRRHASRSLNYNECANPGDTEDDSDSHADGSSDDDDDPKPINGFYNNSYVSSSEDVRELDDPIAIDDVNIAICGDENIPTDDHKSGDLHLEEEEMKFQQEFHGKQSSPKTTKDEQSVDELIAEVLAELAEEEKCEADKKQVLPKAPSAEEIPAASASKMEAEGLLLRKHELENYAMRARDRSWQYVYVVQHGSQLWFYQSKEDHMQGQTYYGEGPLDLTDALVHVASDYSRRRYVFRVQLPSGQRFLFQARDDREMLFWVCSMDSGTGKSQSTGSDTFNGATPGIGVVPPPITGSPSKTDRLRNMIKGSISALTK